MVVGTEIRTLDGDLEGKEGGKGLINMVKCGNKASSIGAFY